MTAALFDTVLVANRGEIACRIIATLRRLGIRSAAVYSDDDAGARHVREADVAVRLGPAAPRESYLNIDAILAACRLSGAQAVHPGYGFLSESADFARALDAAGIVFIGPGVRALELMGDKICSKNHVSSHGVPVVPGIAEPGLTDEQLIEAAAAVGFPLLIKPSAGGGGKGMHAVDRPQDLPAVLPTARRVAASAFGDDTLFLERLIAVPRHIEVQILADTHGNVIHLGERECSLQRRHQKVIEEAPSVLLDEATRARIGEAACEAARSVDYTGAGTVEFLVSDASPGEFFFMEMNTRLQVEHPVTEMVTGLDLVEEQIRIAAGEKLQLAQSDVRLVGHAVEARVYAENPARDFLPTSGQVLILHEPTGEGIRVDSSLLPGLAASSSYDPMLAKIIAWGPDRNTALDRLDAALARTLILGIGTNIEYLRLLINDPEVRAGRLDTTLIERRLPELAFRSPSEAELAAAALLQAEDLADPETSGTEPSPWRRADGWRIGAPRPLSLVFAAASPQASDDVVTVRSVRGGKTVSVNGGPDRRASLLRDGDRALVTLDGVVHPLTVVPVSGAPGERTGERTGECTVWIADAGYTAALRLRTRAELLAAARAAAGRAEGAADPVLRSPMPGTVVAVAVADGDRVTAGQPLLSVEAMKMEHQLVAPVAGTVALSLSPGDLVKADQVLAVVTPDPDATPESDATPSEGAGHAGL
ncbi:biotin carboxylase N-terminal domain-containing protein [Arthrobacter sp. zg-Y820]|uniref:acetyl/propionyl/methylcrotonyl-CoA carboxylase subunit alpha n=1 Tax=unclassified Arthrobacter TaxID=235627 RepID=UPI001E333B6C|nr:MULTISPECIES: biotin carboxylase N-terminal domain-containing protein [unclassified Arthrobacter]MCC9198139.1 biotin/lipoyl-binding protein [Arthrobacter sp. zg-Y820]MDK1281006.1 biotin carboxylase N-terminal domain-containing protein [Arthrobacter sp. zg.Y820]WIB10475.1 biotin carboxylase N-terminal domain-containing protein [Arthrobacter sp. zg-Y820]